MKRISFCGWIKDQVVNLEVSDGWIWMDDGALIADWFLGVIWRMVCWRVVIGQRGWEFFT